MSQIIIGVTLLVCMTAIGIYALYKNWEFKNPYVDEEVDYDNVIRHIGGGVLARKYRYKRTWKNGKVTFITKRVFGHNR